MGLICVSTYCMCVCVYVCASSCWGGLVSWRMRMHIHAHMTCNAHSMLYMHVQTHSIVLPVSCTIFIVLPSAESALCERTRRPLDPLMRCMRIHEDCPYPTPTPPILARSNPDPNPSPRANLKPKANPNPDPNPSPSTLAPILAADKVYVKLHGLHASATTNDVEAHLLPLRADAVQWDRIEQGRAHWLDALVKFSVPADAMQYLKRGSQQVLPADQHTPDLDCNPTVRHGEARPRVLGAHGVCMGMYMYSIHVHMHMCTCTCARACAPSTRGRAHTHMYHANGCTCVHIHIYMCTHAHGCTRDHEASPRALGARLSSNLNQVFKHARHMPPSRAKVAAPKNARHMSRDVHRDDVVLRADICRVVQGYTVTVLSSTCWEWQDCYLRSHPHEGAEAKKTSASAIITAAIEGSYDGHDRCSRSRSPGYRRSPDRGRQRSPDRGKRRSPDRGNRRSRSRSPGRGKRRSPDRGNRRSRSRSPGCGSRRSPDRGNRRSRSRSPGHGKRRSPDRGKRRSRSRSPGRGSRRSPDRGRQRSPYRDTAPEHQPAADGSGPADEQRAFRERQELLKLERLKLKLERLRHSSAFRERRELLKLERLMQERAASGGGTHPGESGSIGGGGDTGGESGGGGATVSFTMAPERLRRTAEAEVMRAKMKEAEESGWRLSRWDADGGSVGGSVACGGGGSGGSTASSGALPTQTPIATEAAPSSSPDRGKRRSPDRGNRRSRSRSPDHDRQRSPGRDKRINPDLKGQEAHNASSSGGVVKGGKAAGPGCGVQLPRLYTKEPCRFGTSCCDCHCPFTHPTGWNPSDAEVRSKLIAEAISARVEMDQRFECGHRFEVRGVEHVVSSACLGKTLCGYGDECTKLGCRFAHPVSWVHTAAVLAKNATASAVNLDAGSEEAIEVVRARPQSPSPSAKTPSTPALLDPRLSLLLEVSLLEAQLHTARSKLEREKAANEHTADCGSVVPTTQPPPQQPPLLPPPPQQPLPLPPPLPPSVPNPLLTPLPPHQPSPAATMPAPTGAAPSAVWQPLLHPVHNAYYYLNIETSEVRWELPTSSMGIEVAAAVQQPNPQQLVPQQLVPQQPILQQPIPQQRIPLPPAPSQLLSQPPENPTSKPIPNSVQKLIATAMGHMGHVRADLHYEERIRGRLIGKKGSQKAAMEASTGTHIFIPDTAAVVVIIGPPSAVDVAKQEIASFCSSHNSWCCPWD